MYAVPYFPGEGGVVGIAPGAGVPGAGVPGVVVPVGLFGDGAEFALLMFRGFSKESITFFGGNGSWSEQPAKLRLDKSAPPAKHARRREAELKLFLLIIGLDAPTLLR